MQIHLRPKSIRRECLLAARDLDVLALRVHKKIPVSRADGAVTLDDLLLLQRRRELHGELDGATVTKRIVGLRIGCVEGREVQKLFGAHADVWTLREVVAGGCLCHSCG